MSYSVSEIINYYFNNKNNKIFTNRSLGFLFHKLISLYLILKSKFDIEYFTKTYNITEYNKYILINLLNKTLTFLDNNNNHWRLMFIEQNINYNNIYGKPDIIFEPNYLNYNSYFFLISQYYYIIKEGIFNHNILDEKSYNHNNRKKIILIDWKCYFKQNIFKTMYSKLNHILNNNLSHTMYNKAMLQMNIYKYILETKYDFYVSEMYIYLIDPSTFNYKLIPILNIKREFIIFLLEYFIKNTNNINNNNNYIINK